MATGRIEVERKVLDQWKQHCGSLPTLRALLNSIGTTVAVGGNALVKTPFSVTRHKLSLYSQVTGAGLSYKELLTSALLCLASH